MSKKQSAGILIYQIGQNPFHINISEKKMREDLYLLGHCGGPFFQNKDLGTWTIPKGEIEDNEDIQDAAIRELKEETRYEITEKENLVELQCIKQKSGKIVFINSGAGLKPFKNSSAYVASKYGLRGFASALREELREYNVKVISAFPGAVNTPLWDNKNAEDIREDMMNVKDLCKTIIHSINAPNNCVVEEILIKRNLGDF